MDAKQWDEHYRRGETPWDLGEPSPVVQRLVGAWVPGGARLLVPGCGYGWDAQALAEAGYEVVALDVSPTALGALEARAGDVAGRLRVREGDLLDLPGDLRGTFDAVVEHTCYCALPPDRWEDYARAVFDALVDGGRLVGAFLLFDGGGPPWGTSLDDVRRIFEPLFDVEHLTRAPEPFGPRGVPQAEAVFRRRPDASGRLAG